MDFETSGPPFEGVEVRVADPDDEGLGKIMTRHPNMMRGYYRDPEETAKAMRDGWMETGDAGYFKEGHLVVVDRFSDLARTAGGARFSPQHLENKLKFSPFIAEAVAIGDGREFLTALLCLRFAVASKWAERRRVAFYKTTPTCPRPRGRKCWELIRAEVARVNESLLPANRIRRFVLLYKELDADDRRADPHQESAPPCGGGALRRNYLRAVFQRGFGEGGRPRDPAGRLHPAGFRGAGGGKIILIFHINLL